VGRRAWQVAAVVMAAGVAACGGGSGGANEAAESVATHLLGSEANDDNRDDHRCIADAVAEAFDRDALEKFAAAPALEDLDVPSRERLLQAALSCVSATQLAG
jgi:hypothetical protein